MKLQVVTANTSCEGPKPVIAQLKDNIAIGVVELNHQAATGALNSFQLTRSRVNSLVDKYIEMRTLTLVR